MSVAVIGLAGGIGAGKSEVARALAGLGCVVSDSDAEAKAALERPDVKARLVEWWGGGVLDAAGGVDRRAVARIVFADPDERARLEGLTHPLVREARDRHLAEAERRGAPALVIDAPLLFEAGLDAECDAVLFVDAPHEVRQARVRAARGWDEGELARREAAQMPIEEKRARSTHIIDNAGSPEALRPRVERALREVLERLSAGGSGEG